MFLVVEDHDMRRGVRSLRLAVQRHFRQERECHRPGTNDRCLSVVDGQGDVSYPQSGQWQDEDNISKLSFQTGDPGTYVLGVSTKPRMIELSAEDFNEYLAHDGVLDVLEAA